MRGEDVLVLLWVLTAWEVSLSQSAPISDVHQELPYVQSVKENEHCFITSPGVSGDRTTCSAGYHRGKGRDCELCLWNYTFQPFENDCAECVRCSDCDDGFRMETPCTRTTDTVCVKSATISPTTEDAVQTTAVQDITSAWLPPSTDLVTREKSSCTDLEPPVDFHILPTAQSIRLSWEQPVPLDGWYTILISKANGNAPLEEDKIGMGEYQRVIPNLEPHTIYQIQIQAHSPNCTSAPTSPRFVQTDDASSFFQISGLSIGMFFIHLVLVFLVAAPLIAVVGFIWLGVKRWMARPAACPDKAPAPSDHPLLDQPEGPGNSEEPDSTSEVTTV